jgi:hypothetical protein
MGRLARGQRGGERFPSSSLPIFPAQKWWHLLSKCLQSIVPDAIGFPTCRLAKLAGVSKPGR